MRASSLRSFVASQHCRQCVKASSSRETGEIPVAAGRSDINGEAMACGGINPGDLVVVSLDLLRVRYWQPKGFHILDGFAREYQFLRGHLDLEQPLPLWGLDSLAGLRIFSNRKSLVRKMRPDGIIIFPY